MPIAVWFKICVYLGNEAYFDHPTTDSSVVGVQWSAYNSENSDYHCKTNYVVIFTINFSVCLNCSLET